MPLSLLTNPAFTKAYACDGHELFYTFRDPATGMSAFYSLLEDRWAVFSRLSDSEFTATVAEAIASVQRFLAIPRH